MDASTGRGRGRRGAHAPRRPTQRVLPCRRLTHAAPRPVATAPCRRHPPRRRHPHRRCRCHRCTRCCCCFRCCRCGRCCRWGSPHRPMGAPTGGPPRSSPRAGAPPPPPSGQNDAALTGTPGAAPAHRVTVAPVEREKSVTPPAASPATTHRPQALTSRWSRCGPPESTGSSNKGSAPVAVETPPPPQRSARMSHTPTAADRRAPATTVTPSAATRTHVTPPAVGPVPPRGANTVAPRVQRPAVPPPPLRGRGAAGEARR